MEHVHKAYERERDYIHDVQRCKEWLPIGKKRTTKMSNGMSKDFTEDKIQLIKKVGGGIGWWGEEK